MLDVTTVQVLCSLNSHLPSYFINQS